jgi:dolichol-phosphate mannosyltransferase
MTDPHLSVVIPVYGCVPCLPELCRRLHQVLRTLTPAYEIILVDDCGPGDAWPAILAQAALASEVRGVRLSRNFGQHAAIAAGLTISRGEWMVVLDCDLQDPPEAIPALYEAARRGADIVFARRRRHSESWWRRAISRTYFRLLNALSDNVIDGREGALTMFSRKVLESYLSLADQDRHHVMLLRWLGYRQSNIDYDRAARETGASAYRWSTLVDSAICGLFFSSARLLRMIVYVGVSCACAGFGLALLLLARSFVFYTAPGWTSIIVMQLIMGGIGIVCVGTVGMYVGRVFDQVRRRPLFIIDSDTAAPNGK